MAKSHRKGARKSHTRRRNQKQQKQQKNQRRQGGYRLEGAPVADSLYGSSSSQMSLSQGQDFGAYHQAQHGGMADYGKAFDVMTDQNMLSSSMSSGQLNAIAEVRPLSDAQPPPLGPTPASPGTTNGGPSGSCSSMAGGRRRRRRRSQKKSKKSKKSQKQQKRQRSQKNQRRRQGGGAALGYAPVGAPGLLLDNNRAYTQAGLNPEYYQSSSTEQLLADMRDSA
jgi:hypothetical protein